MESIEKLKRKVMNPNQDDFNRLISLRLFDHQVEIIEKIILHAKTADGEKKYDSPSHFLRAAVMQQILRDLSQLEIKPGRPKKC